MYAFANTSTLTIHPRNIIVITLLTTKTTISILHLTGGVYLRITKNLVPKIHPSPPPFPSQIILEGKKETAPVDNEANTPEPVGVKR